MDLPLKLKAALTQVCVEIHNATNVTAIDYLADLLELFEKFGYAFPCWISAWVQMLADDPLLNAEEHFKKPKVRSSVFDSMSSRDKHNNNFEKVKVDEAITAICNDPYSAKRNALFVIASVILSNTTDNNDLSYEWHCRTDELQSLTNKHNFALFVMMLHREIEFWQLDSKSRNNPPPKSRLTLSQQSI